MFEKEAEEDYLSNLREKVENNNESRLEEQFEETFQRGAICGYNKANEWHYVKDGDLPKENKLYFVAIKDNGCAIAYFNGLHWETKYNLGDFGHLVETVIAWCEIPTFEKESK